MSSKPILYLLCIVLGGCVTAVTPTKMENIEPSLFRVKIDVPELSSAKPEYYRQHFSNGLYNDYVRIKSDEGQAHTLLIVLSDLKSTNYFGSRSPFDESLYLMHPELRSLTISYARPFTLKTQHGLVNAQRFTAQERDCVVFLTYLKLYAKTAHLGLGDGSIFGYYCAQKGAKIDGPSARSIVSTVRFSGETL